MYQTYERKLEQIEKRYPGMEPKTILKKLLGSDTLRDEKQVLLHAQCRSQASRVGDCSRATCTPWSRQVRAQAQELTHGWRLRAAAFRALSRSEAVP